MKISVSTTINSAHQLPGTLLHGHTYRITAIYDGSKDVVTQCVIPFQELLDALKLATGPMNHDRLERILSGRGIRSDSHDSGTPATAENLAIHVARSLSKHCGRIVNVRVAVGDDGIVETDMYQREDGEYFSK